MVRGAVLMSVERKKKKVRSKKEAKRRIYGKSESSYHKRSLKYIEG
jgi:hypothetical protein